MSADEIAELREVEFKYGLDLIAMSGDALLEELRALGFQVVRLNPRMMRHKASNATCPNPSFRAPVAREERKRRAEAVSKIIHERHRQRYGSTSVKYKFISHQVGHDDLALLIKYAKMGIQRAEMEG